jgi:hypothetical protein
MDRIPLNHTTEGSLRVADAVFAVDPRRPDYEEQVWGQECIAKMSLYPAATPTVTNMFVELDSTDESQLQKLRAIVEAAKV